VSVRVELVVTHEPAKRSASPLVRFLLSNQERLFATRSNKRLSKNS